MIFRGGVVVVIVVVVVALDSGWVCSLPSKSASAAFLLMDLSISANVNINIAWLNVLISEGRSLAVEGAVVLLCLF